MLLFFNLLIFTDPALADGIKVLEYTIAGQHIQIIEDPAQHLRLSQGCRLPDNSGYRCLARKALTEASARGLKPDMHFGAQICVKLHGTLVTGTTTELNEDGFCRFHDGSLVGVGSLNYYGLRNDEKRPRQ